MQTRRPACNRPHRSSGRRRHWQCASVALAVALLAAPAASLQSISTQVAASHAAVGNAAAPGAGHDNDGDHAPSATSRSLGVTWCPRSIDSSAVSYPSTSGICLVLALEAAAFACATFCRYNFVDDQLACGGADPLAARAVSLTSNTYWVVYFAQVALRHGLEVVLYADPHINTSDRAAAYLHFADLTLHALTCLSLTVALLFQYKYRSDPEGFDSSDSEATTDLMPLRSVRRSLLSAEAGLLALALLHIAAAWWATDNLPNSDAFEHSYLLFAIASGLQRLPLLIIAILIVVPVHVWRGLCRSGKGDVQPQPDAASCPTAGTRLALGTAVVLAIPQMIPPAAWTLHILPASFMDEHPCPLWVFSWVDLTLLLQVLALALYFVFVRAEHQRVEQCQRSLALEACRLRFFRTEAERPH